MEAYQAKNVWFWNLYWNLQTQPKPSMSQIDDALMQQRHWYAKMQIYLEATQRLIAKHFFKKK